MRRCDNIRAFGGGHVEDDIGDTFTSKCVIFDCAEAKKAVPLKDCVRNDYAFSSLDFAG